MLIFKCGLIILSSTYICSLCFQVAKDTNSLDIGLALLYIASGLIAGKIIYDRYQQIHVLGSLTPNPNVTSFANRIASFSASFLSLGFLTYFFLFLFKVDTNCLTALNIFICGFGTLYIWMQCIITTYISTLFYNRRLLVLRQCLANVSFLILIILAVFGTVTSFLPLSGARGIYFCFIITSLCSYILAAIFCIFILTFEKDYEYFSDGLRSEMLLDDGSSLNDASISDLDSIYGAQEVTSSTIVIKEAVPSLGTIPTNKAPNSPSYGSFANTNIQAVIKENNYNDNLEENLDIIEDYDSGMSSEENDDSVKLNLSSNNNHVSISSNLDKDEVITKCLIIESQYAEQRNEIPSCSYVNHVSVVIEKDKYKSHVNTDDVIEENSDFVVIDLTCDNLDPHNKELKGVGTNECNIDCDSSIPSLNEDRSLVPVCNEIAITESQKLLSLSLSILLAALLQAMQCFAQFLEDIVVPQRQ
ncbi:hypothetical protein K1T71_001263 [Dendrolimus kikuchii]|uniref:Uncharacterized protein n=1 Tax=Dendrolimus kikuchii TaxID=765133 RepID=A0ACC1DHC0_9NEOP|nr:hypothetical protein K1T71_001263 [Dendrolimus kikuchii]